jgi:hypothetical protein
LAHEHFTSLIGAQPSDFQQLGSLLSQGVSQLSDARWDAIIGCEDGFKSPALAALRSTETYPSLKLECGSLKIAFNRP